MLIGLTYDLIDDYLQMGFSKEEAAEFDKPETIEGIEKALNTLGYETERIGNIFQLMNKLTDGKRWDLVFNISEGYLGFAREAQVPAVLEAYNIPYTFSDPLTLSLTLHKAFTKTLVREAGVPTADFHVITKPGELEKCNLNFPIFAKPLAEGTGKGINHQSKIETNDELRKTCEKLLTQFNQPVLLEEYLPGREFTVGIIGTGDDAKAIGVMEIIYNNNAPHNFYSYLVKSDYQKMVRYEKAEGELVKWISDISLKAWRVIGGRDAGRIDIKLDQNDIPNFIEANPLAGLNPNDSDLPILAGLHGIGYNELIELILKSTLNRIN